MAFDFVEKNGVFKWESDFLSLEFSAPSIQSFNEYTKISSENEIMHYYYKVKIYRKIKKYKFKDTSYIQKELVSKRSTYDFPCIIDFKYILESLIEDNIKHGGQKHKYSNGMIKYSKTLFTEGFACDDFYEVTKFVEQGTNNTQYVVYIGTTFDSEGDLNSSGIRTPYVDEEDIQELLKCVKGFIQYSIDENNKAVDKYKKPFEIKGNKIYEYTMEKNKVNTSKLESIFSVGDELNITTVVNNIQKEYDRVIISDIKDDKIYFNKNTINIKDIVYISNEVSDEKLRYNIDEIADEFLNILSDEEKDEFKMELMSNLLYKYKMAIIGRTWMCRDEHDFNIDYDAEEDRVTAVEPIVVEVIDKIKKFLIK